MAFRLSCVRESEFFDNFWYKLYSCFNVIVKTFVNKNGRPLTCFRAVRPPKNMGKTMTRTQSTLIGLISLLFFILLSVPAFSEEKSSEIKDLGTIKGQILKEGGSAFTPGFVAFFSSENLEPMDFGQTRRSPKMIAFLDDKGNFLTGPMPPGSYYIGAMERKQWRGGPPKMGEVRYSAFDDKGEYIEVTLNKSQELEIGSVVVTVPKEAPELTDFITIEGRLLAEDGKGVPGAVVVVKRDLNTRKAEFISDKSAFNGYYKIQVPPGKYFLIARETVEGSMRPKPDSIYGEFGQNAPIGLGGKSKNPSAYIIGTSGQEYKDVDILMFKVPLPEVRRKETEALVKSEKYSRDTLPENLPLRKQSLDEAVKSEVKAVEGASKKLKIN